MKKKNCYQHLNLLEREEISRGLVSRQSLRTIAKKLGRDVGSISREVNQRNNGRIHYRAFHAEKQATKRYKKHHSLKTKRIDQYPKLKNYIFKKLKLRWSPEQIAQNLKTEYPDDKAMQVSHETIYTYLYLLPKGELRKELLSYLRQKRAWRRTKRKNNIIGANRGKIPEMISIEERPKEVEDRIIPGHWEGDLIIGTKQQSALGSIVERTTRLLILVPLKARDALTVRRAFAREMKSLPKQIKHSLTYDQGSEMTEHKLFSQDAQIKIYFAHPGCPWERGTNENTNGLIRGFFPKNTDFHQVSRKAIKQTQQLLNSRPRKVLGWRTPSEVFSQLLH